MMAGQEDAVPDLDSAEYARQPFDKRLRDGLLIDRSSRITADGCIDSLLMMRHSGGRQEEQARDRTSKKASRDLDDLTRTSWNSMYRYQKLLDNFQFKRKVNAQIVDSTIVHEHIIRLAEPVLCDLLMPRRPTTKDLKNIPQNNASDDDPLTHTRAEKSVRRIVDYYPNIANTKPWFTLPRNKAESVLNEMWPWQKVWPMFTPVRKKDGSCDVYPKLPNREIPAVSDHRLKNIITPYSFSQCGVARFDTKCYVDANYFIRLKKFWKAALNTTLQIMENFGPIRKEMHWFVRHIANNDVGLHVLFDNLSTECEARWFSRLDTPGRMRMADPFEAFLEPHEFTKNDIRQGVSELKGFIKEFERMHIPSPLQQHRIQQRTMGRRMHELALNAADSYHESKEYETCESIMNEISMQF